MRYLFLGLMYDREKEKELLQKIGYVQAQVTQYQWGFIDGFNDAFNTHIDVIASIPSATFPHKAKKLFVGKGTTSSPYGINYVGYVNFYFLREWIRRRSFYKKAKKYISASDEPITVFVYSMYHPFLSLMRKLKKRFGKKLNYVLIVPDLVGEYTFSYKNKIKQAYHSRTAKKQMELAALADGYVLLTEEMKVPLQMGSKPYSVIEGFLPACQFNYTNERQKKTILYTGSLNPSFGIGTLLDAFALIQDEEYRLWICGAGDGQKAVEDAAARDGRIIFKGFLPKSEIADLQTRCDILINPRPGEGIFTKYSFPSKTMEYLLSGSKVIMHRLAGVGEEYYKYIRVIDEHSPEAIARAITSAVADESFYPEKCMEQVAWIKTEKDCRAQARKIEPLLR